MQFLSNIMLDALRFFAYFGGYGWGIIWLTIAVNLALYPLTLSSIQSMGIMQKIQPRIAELQKKYKDDPQQLQKETMELYKSEGINPLGGCLPVILKIPFFLALFWALQSSAFMEIASDPAKNTGFLWINGTVAERQFNSKELAEKLSKAGVIKERGRGGEQERRYVWNAGMKVGEKTLKDLLLAVNEGSAEDAEKVQAAFNEVPLKVNDSEVKLILHAWKETNSLAKPDRLPTPFGPVSVMALLIGITTYLMQKTMPSPTQQMQAMTMVMPVVITFVCWNFPAGVQLYWLVSNAVGAAQQHYIARKPKKVVKKKEEKK